MSTLLKATLGLSLLAAAGLAAHPAQAQNLKVSEATTGSYVYTYNITPAADTTLLTFTFFDQNVNFLSASAPLDQVTKLFPGNFVEFSFIGGTLTGGSTETVAFTSPDAPGSFVNIASVGLGGTGGAQSAGPAPVPEASTTVSFGLLLMLGLGGLVFAAKKKASSAA